MDSSGNLYELIEAAKQAEAFGIKPISQAEFQHLSHVPKQERTSEIERIRNLDNAARRIREVLRGK